MARAKTIRTCHLLPHSLSQNPSQNLLLDAASMAIFRSLKTLISRTRKPPTDPSRTFFTATFSSSFASPLYTDPSVYRRRRHFLARPNFFSPALAGATTTALANSCPLFLSSPPWKLSQAATPLHLQPNLVLLRVRALNLKLPYKLGLQSTSSAPNLLLNGPQEKQFVESQLVEEIRDSFVNLPNFISFSRMLSGPLLAWYCVLVYILSLNN